MVIAFSLGANPANPSVLVVSNESVEPSGLVAPLKNAPATSCDLMPLLLPGALSIPLKNCPARGLTY